jgi:hypothetical protein
MRQVTAVRVLAALAAIPLVAACGSAQPGSADQLPSVADTAVATRATVAEQAPTTPAPAPPDVDDGSSVLSVVSELSAGPSRLAMDAGLIIPDLAPVSFERVMASADAAVSGRVVDISPAEPNFPGRDDRLDLRDLAGTGPVLITPTTWVTVEIADVLGVRPSSKLELRPGLTISLPFTGGSLMASGTKEALAEAGLPDDIAISYSASINIDVGDDVIVPIRTGRHYLATRSVVETPAFETRLTTAFGSTGVAVLLADGSIASSENVPDLPAEPKELAAAWSKLNSSDEPSIEPGPE